MEHTALTLIDKLIACWTNWNFDEEYYLTVLTPSIVRSVGSAHLMDNEKLNDREKKIVTELRPLLSQEEWQQLPTLIAQRRVNKLKELDSDRQRAKALRKAERERRRAEEARIARKRALVDRLEDVFDSDFLSADGVLAADPDAELISGDEYDELKTRFVLDWAARELPQGLDPEQAAAVAATSGDVQVVARAGSGKTKTLVTRAIFLQKHCRVSPHEILLLAFNKKAAEEIQNRLAQMIDEDLPHVMTFHALAYAIVHPEESLLYDGSRGENQSLSRVFQQVIDDHLGVSAFKAQIRELMLAHFREDWERIVAGGYDKGKEELLEFRRSLPREGLRGEYLKSYGEKVIADFLFEHDVPYKYERNHWWSDVNYRPDFTIFKTKKSGVIIEYFGRQGEGDYDENSQAKRDYWARKPHWSLLEFAPSDITTNGVEKFRKRLKASLEKLGVSCKRLSEDEIWHRVRDRAIDRFTTSCVTFIGRCRKRWLTSDELDTLIEDHTTLSTVEGMFLRIISTLYEAYLGRLDATGEEDFDGLMQRAA